MGRKLGGGFSAWSLGRKLGVGFGAVVAIFCLAIGVTLVFAGDAQDSWSKTRRWSAAIEGARLLASGTQAQMRAQSMGVAFMDPGFKKDFDDAVAISDKGAAAVEEIGDPVIATAAAAANESSHKHDAAVNDKLFPAIEKGDVVAAKAALAEADKSVGAVFDGIKQINERVAQLAAADQQRATDTANTARLSGIGATIAGVLIAIVLALGIGRSTRRPIAELAAITEQAAAGDLTVRSPRSGSDELGRLAQAFNTMAESLADLVRKIQETAQRVSTSSSELASTSREAGRTGEEIARAIRDVAAGAERQATITADVMAAASTATAVASEGVISVQSASSAMASVRESSLEVSQVIGDLGSKSEQIGGIVATITGIAEQTNLLALNAAIEAARAGEQGRGFAVVADEVRKLAEESQRAAGSIASLIAEIQQATGQAIAVVDEGARRIDGGAATVEEARAAFGRIAASTAEVHEGLGEVSAVAQQTSAASEQVSASSEEGTAQSQEVAANADELQRSAAALELLVSQFRI